MLKIATRWTEESNLLPKSVEKKQRHKLKLTHLLTYLFTYLLTSWSIILLEMLTGSQLVKKFRAIYGTRMFITAFKTARHLSLSHI